LASFEIGPNGEVIVSEEDADTFRDMRLPQHERVIRLAILLGADERYSTEAELLLKDAAVRLNTRLSEGIRRQAAIAQQAQHLSSAQLEIRWLKAENAELNGRLQKALYELYLMGKEE
jgi:hypothetical protein